MPASALAESVPPSKRNRIPPGAARTRAKEVDAHQPAAPQDEPALLGRLAPAGLPRGLSVRLDHPAGEGPAALVRGVEDEQPAAPIPHEGAGQAGIRGTPSSAADSGPSVVGTPVTLAAGLRWPIASPPPKPRRTEGDGGGSPPAVPELTQRGASRATSGGCAPCRNPSPPGCRGPRGTAAAELRTANRFPCFLGAAGCRPRGPPGGAADPQGPVRSARHPVPLPQREVGQRRTKRGVPPDEVQIPRRAAVRVPVIVTKRTSGPSPG